MPVGVSLALGGALLPFYLPFRRRTRAKLRRLEPTLAAWTYYRMRLRLALLSVRGTSQGSGDLAIEGGGIFADAISSGKPVLLLGWHQGPVEALHEIPAVSATGRPFFVMTASAFSPVLADWMARRRRRAGAFVIRPDETDALRRWAREGGILAVMVDQVPGETEEQLSLRNGSVTVPWPSRLLEWALGREPEILVVSARVESSSRIVLRYDQVARESLKKDIAKLMDDGLCRAPEQYNWSYGKAYSWQRTANSE